IKFRATPTPMNEPNPFTTQPTDNPTPQLDPPRSSPPRPKMLQEPQVDLESPAPLKRKLPPLPVDLNEPRNANPSNTPSPLEHRDSPAPLLPNDDIGLSDPSRKPADQPRIQLP